MKISIITPIYNEAENLNELFEEIKNTLVPLNIDYEIIGVNDGSSDNSARVLEELAKKDKRIKVINFSRNLGQTAAMVAGFDAASGEIIVPIDADLQNDPKDIPRLLEKINEGYDLVSGWRHERQENLILRKIPSWTANYIIARITKAKFHDLGCSLKAYRREILEPVKLYGEMHRFIPVLAVWYGAKYTEVKVSDRRRKFGKTNYGISRTFRVILDLLTVKFLTKYITRPMHFFGKAGFYCLLSSFLSGVLAIILRLFFNTSLISTPLPLLTVFLAIVSVQFILMGLLAEILVRIYFESQSKPIYQIKNKINF